MKAARLHAYGSPLRLDEVPRPRPGPGQVLVKIAGAGFCHSDIHIIDGELPVIPVLPQTLGHENAGYVAELGAGVTEVKEGDPVLVFGGWGCGRCFACLVGNEQLCATAAWCGVGQPGGYAEFLLVPNAGYLVPLRKLSPEVAAPVADAALTPYRAVKKALPFLEPDHLVLSIGVGGLGAFGLELLAKLSGCGLIAVDVNPQKLDFARGLGAHHVFDGRDPKLIEKIRDLTGGVGVCAAFDFVGSDATLDACIRSTRALGKVTQVGLAGGTAQLHVLQNSPFELTFDATLWGNVKELHEVLSLIENGRVQMLPVEHAPLEQINDVYDRLKRGEVKGRIVVTP